MPGKDERGRSDFEQQVRDLELELKQGQIALQKLEQQLKTEEHLLKTKEFKSSKWRNPIFVAVLAAAVAGGGNAIVALVNNRNLRDVEEQKAQSSLILEAVKTGDPDKASVNLRFLLAAGLLSDSRAAAIRYYLSHRPAGTGAALPTASGHFRLEAAPNPPAASPPTQFRLKGAESLPTTARTTLNNRLTSFANYMRDVGLRTNIRRFNVEINDREASANAYYNSQNHTITMGSQVSSDPAASVWPYAQFLFMGITSDSPQGDVEANALKNGLSDYFTASFLNNPRIGADMAAALHMPNPYLRNLENHLPYNRELEAHELGAIWGGAFWEIRTRLGRERADRLVARAWLAVSRTDERQIVAMYLRSITTFSQDLPAEDSAAIGAIFRARGFPNP